MFQFIMTFFTKAIQIYVEKRLFQAKIPPICCIHSLRKILNFFILVLLP